MDKMMIFAASGFLGGIARALVGILKGRETYKEEFKMRWSKIIFTIMASGIIGLCAGLLVNDLDYRVAILAGYAGTDMIESLYKMRNAQGTLA